MKKKILTFQRILLLNTSYFQDADKDQKDNGTVGWKPLTSGIRLENFSKSSPIRNKRKKTINKDDAESRIDIETSDNMPHLSVSKPEGRAIKLEPLKIVCLPH